MLDNLNPPFGLSPLLLVLAIATVLLGLFLVFLPLIRRLYRRFGQRHLAVPEHVRTKYEKEIDALSKEWEEGKRTGRATAQELSTLIRRFAHDAWEIDISHMTLRELKEHGIRPVAIAVENLYLPTFGTAEVEDVSANLREVRKVVGMWTF